MLSMHFIFLIELLEYRSRLRASHGSVFQKPTFTLRRADFGVISHYFTLDIGICLYFDNLVVQSVIFLGISSYHHY